jgi:hypothetical protein
MDLVFMQGIDPVGQGSMLLHPSPLDMPTILIHMSEDSEFLPGVIANQDLAGDGPQLLASHGQDAAGRFFKRPMCTDRTGPQRIDHAADSCQVSAMMINV